MLFINKLFNSIACLLSFTNLQLVIPGRTWILLYLGRTVYKRLWACLALYRHIMLELSTIKTDFLFENSQDFNQTTHARPQHPIVFIHNISLYFNCISSVK